MVNVCVPVMAFDPLQLAEAVHDVALVLDQFSVLEPPLEMEVGVALNVTVGVGAATATLTV